MDNELIEKQIRDIEACVRQLAILVQRLRLTVEQFSPEESKEEVWIVRVDRGVLQLPSGSVVSLNRDASTFMMELAAAPEQRLSHHTIATSLPHCSRSQIATLVARLRRRVGRESCDLPIVVERNLGYWFQGTLAVSPSIPPKRESETR